MRRDSPRIDSAHVDKVTSCFSRLVYQLRVAHLGVADVPLDVWSLDEDPRYPGGWFAEP
jgi:hypothetical protein